MDRGGGKTPSGSSRTFFKVLLSVVKLLVSKVNVNGKINGYGPWTFHLRLESPIGLYCGIHTSETSSRNGVSRQ